MNVSPKLVLVCNSPDTITILENFITKQTTHKPEFHESGWSTGHDYNEIGDNTGTGYGYSNGKGYGCGYGNGFGNGNGTGSGYSNGDGNGEGY